MSEVAGVNITSTADPVLFVLLLHLKQKTSVDIYYAKKGEPFSKRKITPRRIYEVRFRESPYVDAYCHLKQADRVFRADRIRIEGIGNFKTGKEKEVVSSSSPNKVKEIVDSKKIGEENLKATRQEETNIKITSPTDNFELKEFSKKPMGEDTSRNIDHDHVRSVIDDLRKRLFDFSKRNPLINLTHSERSVRFIRVVDELPDELYTRLEMGLWSLSPSPILKMSQRTKKQITFALS